MNAICTTNMHGRLLHANEKFCKLFGFDAVDVAWRYILDLHRNLSDWEMIQRSLEESSSIHLLQLRMRHRKGRSFPCEIKAQCVELENGSIGFRMEIQKQLTVATEDLQIGDMSTNRQQHNLVYLTACHACGKVKDSAGKWVTPLRPVAKTKHRKPCYCHDCSAALFPDLVEVQAVAH